MKKCPNCQKTFDDSKRFCQVDGTPLVDVVESVQTEDPFKTVVIGQQPSANVADDPMKTTVIRGDSKEDDILQIPEEFDPMKTMVVSEPIKLDNPVVKTPINEPVVPAPEPPKFSEPNLSPPKLEDLSPVEPPKVETPKVNPFNEPPKVETPVAKPFNEPPKVDSPIVNPFNEPPKVDSPFNVEPKSVGTDSPFSVPSNNPISSPFEQKSESQPPPFKEPEPPFNAPPSPFDSPFNQPSEPVGQELQSNWNPPPVPNDQWNQQEIGSNTPFQPPPVGIAGGQNQTSAIVSLVLGILSCLCCFSIITGPAAIIVGLKARSKAAANPNEFGGSGLALAGMITGGIGAVVGTIVMILQLLPYILRMF